MMRDDILIKKTWIWRKDEYNRVYHKELAPFQKVGAALKRYNWGWNIIWLCKHIACSFTSFILSGYIEIVVISKTFLMALLQGSSVLELGYLQFIIMIFITLKSHKEVQNEKSFSLG